VFAKKMVEKYRFSLERAAHHPHCPSAKSFYDGLLELADPSGLGLHRLTKPAPEQP
jgi:hypothetical protein